MSDVAASGVAALPRFATAIRRHRSVVLMSVVLAVFAGLAYATQTPQRFSAEAVILLQPVPGNPFSSEAASGGLVPLTTAMETEAGIMRSSLIAALVADRIGTGESNPDGRAVVRVPTGTQMLRVSATGSSAADAANAAQAYAEEYLGYREERATTQVASRLDLLEEQAELTDGNLRRVLEQAEDPASDSFASQEVQLYADRLAQLRDEMSALETVSTNPGQVLNPAEPPSTPDGLGPWLLVAAAAFVGLMIGVVAAYVREFRKDLVRDDEELAVPTLADLRVVDGRIGPDTRGARSDDAYRQFRAALTANTTRPHVVAVAGLESGVASGGVAGGLAFSLAEAGYSVVAIAANAQSAALERTLAVQNAAGLADVLCGTASVEDAIVVSQGVAVLGRGRGLLASRELLAGPQLRDLIGEFRDAYDYVIVDAASTASGDGNAVISRSDSTVVVLAPDRTTHEQVQNALNGLELLGARVVGVVRLRDSEIDPFVIETFAALWPGSHIERWRRGGSIRYVPLPRSERATIVVPPTPLSVAAAALRRHRASAGRSERWAARFREAAARAGALRLVRGSLAVVASDPTESLIDHISDDLGVEVWAAIHIGPRRANRKPILHLIDRDGQSVAFVKVGLNDLTRRLVRAEADALEVLAKVGFEELVVPEVLGVGSWRHCEYLVLSPVQTESRNGIDTNHLHRAMQELVSALPTKSVVLVRSKWWGDLLTALRDRDHADARALLDLADRFRAVFGTNRLMMGAAHGDWAPWNMATTKEGTVVWDWERFDRSVPVGFDSLHYAVETAARHDRRSPRRAISEVAERAGSIVAENGAPSELGRQLMVLYLLAIGERYVTDRQDLAGARRGDLGAWLLPELARLVEVVEATGA